MPIAAAGGHGCAVGAQTCGARDSQCYDCLLDCRSRTLALERLENQGLREALARLELDKNRAFKAAERAVRPAHWKR